MTESGVPADEVCAVDPSLGMGLTSGSARLFIRFGVVIGGREETVERYKQFFGLNERQIKSGGVGKWTEKRLNEFVKEYAK